MDHSGDAEGAKKQQKIIGAVDRHLIELNRPYDFRTDNPESILKEMDMSFEDTYSAMEEAGVSNPKKMSVFEYHAKIQYFNKKRKPKY